VLVVVLGPVYVLTPGTAMRAGRPLTLGMFSFWLKLNGTWRGGANVIFSTGRRRRSVQTARV